MARIEMFFFVAYITGAVEMTMVGLTVLLPSLQLPE